ncbi:LGFP repeat-containing protein [Corynebacterium sp. CCM 9203]|uniref:LGFP repeat-containing protein n=1 Tax=Corynebacterium sp. CCM 9203 TaxID=3057615 RepID=UPI0035253932
MSDRNKPSIEEQLEQYELDHPEEVAEHERQVGETADNLTTLPAPKKTLVEGEMRSDAVELPEGVTKGQADQIEIEEGRRNVQPQMLAATGCQTVWPTGFQVCGAILDAYREIGGTLSWLGPPKSNELTNPDGVGKRSEFYGGSIYWHPDTGAHAVTLDGMRQWGTLKWESGPLGYPTSSPIDTNVPLTQMQKFTGGDNYYNPLTGGAVWGDIKQRYDELGGSHHAIGIPITNEMSNGDRYRYNNFSNGTISWRNDRQTRFMYLATKKVWDALGRETGKLGWPTTDELAYIPGVAHHVDFGMNATILWGAAVGARELTGGIVTLWNQLGGIDGLGLPHISSTSFEDSVMQRFEKGAAWATEDGIAHMGGVVDGTIRSQQIEEVPTEKDAPESAGLRSASRSGTGDIIYPKNPGVDPHFLIRRGYWDPQDLPGVGFGADKAKYKHGVTRWDMVEAANTSETSTYFSPTESGAEGWETKVFFKACSFGKCEEYADPVILRHIYLAENREWFKGVPGRNGSDDTADLGLVNAFCGQDDKIVVNFCPERMRETKRFGRFF